MLLRCGFVPGWPCETLKQLAACMGCLPLLLQRRVSQVLCECWPAALGKEPLVDETAKESELCDPVRRSEAADLLLARAAAGKAAGESQ